MSVGSPLLSAIPGLRQVFFPREGGVCDGIYASLNGGLGSPDDPANVRENRRRMAAQLGVAPEHFLGGFQIPSPDAGVAAGPGPGKGRPRAGAIGTPPAGPALRAAPDDRGPT